MRSSIGSALEKLSYIWMLFQHPLERAVFGLNRGIDRDRGTPRDATPPTPPGIRVPYHGGSTELGLGGRLDWEDERLEIGVA